MNQSNYTSYLSNHNCVLKLPSHCVTMSQRITCMAKAFTGTKCYIYTQTKIECKLLCKATYMALLLNTCFLL